MSGGDYEVGKYRPPKHTQFQKGQPRPKGAGRKKAMAVHIGKFFDEPMTVPIDGRPTKMASLEVALTNLSNRAIKGDMRAARRVIELFIEAGLLTGDNLRPGRGYYQVNTAVWDSEEWLEQFSRSGPPPWDGTRDGLCNQKWREETVTDD